MDPGTPGGSTTAPDRQRSVEVHEVTEEQQGGGMRRRMRRSREATEGGRNEIRLLTGEVDREGGPGHGRQRRGRRGGGG
eukprot:7945770-Pyramimonas_sp.AAC.1